MVSIRNLEKFFDDHPEFSARKDAVLAAAKESTENGTVMVGQVAEKILGDLSAVFFLEIEKSPAHQKIGLEDISNMGSVG